MRQYAGLTLCTGGGIAGEGPVREGVNDVQRVAHGTSGLISRCVPSLAYPSAAR